MTNTTCFLCKLVIEKSTMEKLDCGHIFHSECVQRWISYSEGQMTCPKCSVEVQHTCQLCKFSLNISPYKQCNGCLTKCHTSCGTFENGKCTQCSNKKRKRDRFDINPIPSPLKNSTRYEKTLNMCIDTNNPTRLIKCPDCKQDFKEKNNGNCSTCSNLRICNWSIRLCHISDFDREQVFQNMPNSGTCRQCYSLAEKARFLYRPNGECIETGWSTPARNRYAGICCGAVNQTAE